MKKPPRPSSFALTAAAVFFAVTPLAGAQDPSADPFAEPAPEPRVASEAPVISLKQQVIWADAGRDSNALIEGALASDLTSTGFDFTETPLEEIIEFLRDEYRIEVQIDRAALDELGIDADELVTINVRNVSIGAALRLMLEPLELTYTITNEVLLITTEEQDSTYLKLAVYPVADLLVEGDYDSLMDTLISTVASATWAENGGGEAEIRPLEPGMLVVSQTRAVHEEIAQALTAIRRARQALPAPTAADEAAVVTRGYSISIPSGDDRTKTLASAAELVRLVVDEAAVEDDSAARFINVVAGRIVVRDQVAVHRKVCTFLDDAGLTRGGGRGLGGGGGGGFGGGGGIGGGGFGGGYGGGGGQF